MDLSALPPGKGPPEDIYVVIEIPQGSQVKYEMDKASGAIMVDRFLFTPMAYPAAYGFIPGTLAEDGDPADAMVLLPAPVVPGAVVRARPIGVLLMEDEAGRDEKIVCVPHDKAHTLYSEVTTTAALPAIVRDQIEHFFTRYKDLEKGKWVKVTGWAGPEEARDVVRKAIEAGGRP